MKKILVVEDDPVNQMILMDFLAANGYQTIAASPGLQAIELTADQPERWQALVARAWPPEPGIRTRLWAGGPVASNRFV